MLREPRCPGQERTVVAGGEARGGRGAHEPEVIAVVLAGAPPQTPRGRALHAPAGRRAQPPSTTATMGEVAGATSISLSKGCCSVSALRNNTCKAPGRVCYEGC